METWVARLGTNLVIGFPIGGGPRGVDLGPVPGRRSGAGRPAGTAAPGRTLAAGI